MACRWENHQQSKKHKKIVAQLRRQLEEEDEVAASGNTMGDEGEVDEVLGLQTDHTLQDEADLLEADLLEAELLERFSDESDTELAHLPVENEEVDASGDSSGSGSELEGDGDILSSLHLRGKEVAKHVSDSVQNPTNGVKAAVPTSEPSASDSER